MVLEHLRQTWKVFEKTFVGDVAVTVVVITLISSAFVAFALLVIGVVHGVGAVFG